MTMTLLEAIDAYITLKRSLGAVFRADTRVLRSFGRVFGDIPLGGIDRKAIHDFCRGKGPPTPWWERKDTALRGFFAYLVSRGHLAACPLPEQRPRVTRSFQPHIYTPDELRRLLDATAILEDSCFPLQRKTFKTLLLLLYGAGLRPSEGVRLRCRDVDLRERVLTVSDTKFFKSRLVPIGAVLATGLAKYYQERQHLLPMPAKARSAFFASHTGDAIRLGKLESVFAQLRKEAGLQSPPGARWQPRLHDLRHTFAVNRLIAWYREGADVQSCLPFLSTYLGHANISGTQAYLTMTPELLTEASKRFARYAAAKEGDNDND